MVNAQMHVTPIMSNKFQTVPHKAKYYASELSHVLTVMLNALQKYTVLIVMHIRSVQIHTSVEMGHKYVFSIDQCVKAQLAVQNLLSLLLKLLDCSRIMISTHKL